jgi:transposase-like protein
MLYTQPSVPASFSGLAKFKQNHKNVKTNPIKELEAYYMHKQTPKTFARCQTIVNDINSEWQVDLIDIKNKKHEKYLLTVIDVFSRYAFVEPLKNKSGSNTAQAFQKILKKIQSPMVVYSDAGNEFKGECKRVFQEYKITHLKTKSILKAAVVERFNRTLRLKIERYLTYAKSNIFTNVLQDLVDSYNNTIHPFHGYTPAQVYNMPEEKRKILKQLVYKHEKPFEKMSLDDFKSVTVDFKFKIGDYVRLVEDKKLFQKSSTFKKWSDEIFVIDELCPTLPATYKVKRVNGNIIDWRYYKEEIQKVKAPKVPEPKEKIIQKPIDKSPQKIRRSDRLKK